MIPGNEENLSARQEEPIDQFEDGLAATEPERSQASVGLERADAGFAWTHPDGHISRAETVDEVIKLCPFLGRLAREQAELVLQVQALGKAKMASRQELGDELPSTPPLEGLIRLKKVAKIEEHEDTEKVVAKQNQLLPSEPHLLNTDRSHIQQLTPKVSPAATRPPVVHHERMAAPIRANQGNKVLSGPTPAPDLHAIVKRHAESRGRQTAVGQHEEWSLRVAEKQQASPPEPMVRPMRISAEAAELRARGERLSQERSEMRDVFSARVDHEPSGQVKEPIQPVPWVVQEGVSRFEPETVVLDKHFESKLQENREDQNIAILEETPSLLNDISAYTEIHTVDERRESSTEMLLRPLNDAREERLDQEKANSISMAANIESVRFDLGHEPPVSENANRLMSPLEELDITSSSEADSYIDIRHPFPEKLVEEQASTSPSDLWQNTHANVAVDEDPKLVKEDLPVLPFPEAIDKLSENGISLKAEHSLEGMIDEVSILPAAETGSAINPPEPFAETEVPTEVDPHDIKQETTDRETTLRFADRSDGEEVIVSDIEIPREAVVDTSSLVAEGPTPIFSSENSELRAEPEAVREDAESVVVLDQESALKERGSAIFKELINISRFQELGGGEEVDAEDTESDVFSMQNVIEELELNRFAAFAAAQTELEKEITLDTIHKAAAVRRPLGEVFIQLKTYLEESTPEENERVASLIHTIYDASHQPNVQWDGPDSRLHLPVLTSEISLQLLRLLEMLGYEDPEEALRTFIWRYDLGYLFEAIHYLQLLTLAENQREFLWSHLPIFNDVHYDLPSTRLGRTIMELFCIRTKTAVRSF